MACIKCGSERIAMISAKCSDLFSFNSDEYCTDGYVPYGLGIGGGDYVEFDYCLKCGQIQDEFPIETPKKTDEDDLDELGDSGGME